MMLYKINTILFRSVLGIRTNIMFNYMYYNIQYFKS